MQTFSPHPIKTIHSKKLAFLDSVAQDYREDGYSVRVDGRNNLVEIYDKGVVIPQQPKEATL